MIASLVVVEDELCFAIIVYATIRSGDRHWLFCYNRCLLFAIIDNTVVVSVSQIR